MSEREYAVTEPMRTHQTYYVRARTRAEAIEKVERSEYDYVVQGDVLPSGKLRANRIMPRGERA